jgi:hypothetical protein
MDNKIGSNGLFCAKCVKLPLGIGGTKPHADMTPESNGKYENSRGNTETTYRCAKCHTIWARRTNRWGADCGFRLAP